MHSSCSYLVCRCRHSGSVGSDLRWFVRQLQCRIETHARSFRQCSSAWYLLCPWTVFEAAQSMSVLTLVSCSSETRMESGCYHSSVPCPTLRISHFLSFSWDVPWKILVAARNKRKFCIAGVFWYICIALCIARLATNRYIFRASIVIKSRLVFVCARPRTFCKRKTTLQYTDNMYTLLPHVCDVGTSLVCTMGLLVSFTTLVHGQSSTGSPFLTTAATTGCSAFDAVSCPADRCVAVSSATRYGVTQVLNDRSWNKCNA